MLLLQSFKRGASYYYSNLFPFPFCYLSIQELDCVNDLLTHHIPLIPFLMPLSHKGQKFDDHRQKKSRERIYLHTYGLTCLLVIICLPYTISSSSPTGCVLQSSLSSLGGVTVPEMVAHGSPHQRPWAAGDAVTDWQQTKVIWQMTEMISEAKERKVRSFQAAVLKCRGSPLKTAHDFALSPSQQTSVCVRLS